MPPAHRRTTRCSARAGPEADCRVGGETIEGVGVELSLGKVTIPVQTVTRGGGTVVDSETTAAVLLVMAMVRAYGGVSVMSLLVGGAEPRTWLGAEHVRHAADVGRIDDFERIDKVPGCPSLLSRAK